MNQYDQNLFSIDPLDYNDYFGSILLEDSPLSNNYSESKPLFQNDDYLQHQKTNLDKTVTNVTANTFEFNLQKIDIQVSRITQIEFSAVARSKVSDTVQGTKDDTVDLNVNFKTIILNIFKELMILHQLTPKQIQQVQDFISRPPSFKSLYVLCWCGPVESTIRQKLRSVMESKKFMARILSNRSSLSTKLQMIKFVEVLRRNAVGQKGIIKWKQLLNK